MRGSLVHTAFLCRLANKSQYPLSLSQLPAFRPRNKLSTWFHRRELSNTKAAMTMTKNKPPCTVYVNGAYVPDNEARISIFDRGFMFADSVYEVTAVLNGRLIDYEYHVARLQRSLKQLSMSAPFKSENEILGIQQELIKRNDLKEGLIYLQVSRGAALERDFLFPQVEATPPTLVAIPQHKSIIKSALAERGAKVIVTEDIRWGRRDIKTTQLVAQILAKQAAHDAGVDDAWMFEKDTGFITEASSANAYILTQDNVLVTRHLGNAILPGITRQVVLSIAKVHDAIKDVVERPFTVDEAVQAKEAFSTASASLVTPVVEINGVTIGNGAPGSFTKDLRARYIERALSL
jgi:D-alanine transaminase